MTYDEWEKSQATPPPPFSVGGIEYGKNSIPPPKLGGLLSGPPNLGATVYNAFRRAQDYLSRGMARPTTDPSFSPMPGGQPSFVPPPGERLALQMPGLQRVMDARRRMLDLSDPQVRYLNPSMATDTIPLPGLRQLSDRRVNPPPSLRRDLSRLRDWWIRTGYQEPPNFRAMPQYNSGPEATPYPRPPWLNFSNWMDTGERGPLPLQSYPTGGYPAPANQQMPEAYDTLTSGGALA